MINQSQSECHKMSFFYFKLHTKVLFTSGHHRAFLTTRPIMLPQCSGINCDGTALVHIISRFYHIDHCLSHWTAFYVTGDFRHFKMFRFWGFLAIFWCTWLWSASLISLIVTMWNWMMYAIMPLTLVQFLLHMWKMLKSSASYLCIVFCFFCFSLLLFSLD